MPCVQPSGGCSVKVDTTDSRYMDDAWIGVPVIVRDYSKQSIYFGDQFYAKASVAICATTVQVSFTSIHPVSVRVCAYTYCHYYNN